MGVNWFGGFDPDVQKEFDDALANPRYTVFQSRGTAVEVRIGVVRVGSIEHPGVSLATEAVGPSHKAFLDVIAAAEGTSYRRSCGDKGGYNVAFSGVCLTSFEKPLSEPLSSGGYSSAASGRYQFMPFTWNAIQSALQQFEADLMKGQVGEALARLVPFGPRRQDAGALTLIKYTRGQTGAWDLLSKIQPDADGTWQIEDFNAFKSVLNKLAPEWASLPNWRGRSYYGQPVHLAGYLWPVFKAAYPIYAGTGTGAGGAAQEISEASGFGDEVLAAEGQPEGGVPEDSFPYDSELALLPSE